MITTVVFAPIATAVHVAPEVLDCIQIVQHHFRANLKMEALTSVIAVILDVYGAIFWPQLLIGV